MGRQRRKKIRRTRDQFTDDYFSRELGAQGEDGKLMRMLYLRNEMDTYKRRLMDEPVSH